MLLPETSKIDGAPFFIDQKAFLMQIDELKEPVLSLFSIGPASILACWT